jgi:hypothetical protein
MAKYICVKLSDSEVPVKVEADRIEIGWPKHILKKGDVVVGEFLSGDVRAWWEEHDPPSAEK